MEAILDCYFDNFFGGLDRGSLFSRYKRKQIVDYLKTIIEGCRKAEKCTEQEGSRLAVLSVIKCHRKYRDDNGRICLLGKYHNILYAGIRLCYDFRLEDSKTVCELLREIFSCEKTFERIFTGAIFGVKVSHFVAGWKSDFEDQDENVSALLYFSEHANRTKEIYQDEMGGLRRFLDVPMTSVSNSSPLTVAAQVPNSETILLLLRYGCSFEDESGSPIEPILKFLKDRKENNRDYPENCVECLKIFLRANRSTDLGVDEIFPDRSGILLKHLCRCRIREILYENWQLPYGIGKLGLPKSLSDYVDLLDD